MVSPPIWDPTVGIIKIILFQQRMLSLWSTLFSCFLHTEL